jgi:CelD/BcsL family acetyltransferase involved in cellulose biosynthesis
MQIGVELFDDLDAVARDAEGALDRAAQASLFDRLDWYRLTQSRATPAGRLLAVRARDGDASGWLFLAVEGRRAAAFESWYTLRYAASFSTGEPAAQHRLAAAIAGKLKRLRLAEISLYPLAAGDPLAHAFRRAGWLISSRRAGSNWVIRLEDSDFDRYWAARPARLRHTAERKARSGVLDIAVHRRFDAQAWNDYEAVYRASWKPAEGSPAFLRALAEQEGAAGTLRLGIARHRGDPVAAQLWLVENGVATIHKLAHVQSARSLSPGTLLTREMFRDIITRDQPRLIDFGTGDDPYKADWMDERRPLYRLTAWNPLTLRGLHGAGRRIAATLVRAAPTV